MVVICTLLGMFASLQEQSDESRASSECIKGKKYDENLYLESRKYLTLWFLISFQFPTLQTLGEDLVIVLDFLHVKYVIGLGEGAGANVLARFGIANPARALGLILINCTGSAASVLENFKNKVCILCVRFSVITLFTCKFL